MTIHKDYHIDATSATLKETRRMPAKSAENITDAEQQLAEWVAHLKTTTDATDWVGSYTEYTWDPLAPVEYTPEDKE